MTTQTFNLTAHTLEAAWWRQRYEVQADTIEEAAKKLAAYIENPADGTTGVDEDGDAKEEEHEGRLDPEQNFGDSTLTIRRSGDWLAPPLWTNELPQKGDECAVFLRGLRKGIFPSFDHAATFILNSTDSWPADPIEGSTYEYLDALQTRDKSPVLQDWAIIRTTELPTQALFTVTHGHRFGEDKYAVSMHHEFVSREITGSPNADEWCIIEALGIEYEPGRDEWISIERADQDITYINL